MEPSVVSLEPTHRRVGSRTSGLESIHRARKTRNALQNCAEFILDILLKGENNSHHPTRTLLMKLALQLLRAGHTVNFEQTLEEN